MKLAVDPEKDQVTCLIYICIIIIIIIIIIAVLYSNFVTRMSPCKRPVLPEWQEKEGMCFAEISNCRQG
jgi:putative hemolysin